MDSLALVDLRNELQSQVARQLPSTLVFDHPTALDLAGYLSSLVPDAARGDTSAPSEAGKPALQPMTHQSGNHACVAVLNHIIRTPHDKLWCDEAAEDAVTTVPLQVNNSSALPSELPAYTSIDTVLCHKDVSRLFRLASETWD